MLQPGTQVGRYEIQRRLGRGGMGTVYVALDPVLRRSVALKVFLSDLELADAAERFSREARSAAALNHANIVTVHDFGDVSLQPYIVMEYVEGETLAEIVKRKAPVPTAEKLRWIEELCSGVAYAHQHSVIHRDIKPTNLMIDRSGRLKILDFGIAKMLGTLATNATALIGTPGYMAPEQILGGTIDFRSDLFSIGVVCYELLAYAEAFPGETIPAITHRIVSDEPAPLSRLVPDLHPELITIVERALKKSPTDRFPDAEAFRLAVTRVRRQLENETGWEPTMIPARSPHAPDAGVSKIGTGSARKHANDVVSVAELTPPPDPRKTDKEVLQRRRVAQVTAALESARSHVDKGLLDEALDACHQALTLDEASIEALQLLPQIQAAIAKQQASALLVTAREELRKGQLTAAQSFLQQARTLDPDAHDAKRIERDLRLARVEQERVRQRADAATKTLVAALQAFDRGEIEAALAGARQVLEFDPQSGAARRLEADAVRRLEDEVALPLSSDSGIHPASAVATIVAPPRQKVARSTNPPGSAALRAAQSAAASASIAIHAFIASVQLRLRATPAKQKRIAALTAAAIVVVAAIGAIAFLLPPAVVPTGTVVIDAVPWASITAIKAQDGSDRPLPDPASTPVAIDLPVGTYTVHLAGPPPASDARIVTVEVQANGLSTAPVERFGALTPEEYFEQYLAPLAPVVTPEPAPSGADAPPSPPADSPAAAKPPGSVQ